MHNNKLELGENAFWAIVWLLVAIGICTLITICLYFNSKENTLIATSTDPIATACALGTRATVSNQCTALLARGK